MSLATMPEMLTVDEVATRWRISPETVRAMLRAKKIKGQRFGAQWRVKREVVEQYESSGEDFDAG